MKTNKQILIIVTLLALASCKIDPIDSWSAKGRVWFTSDADTIFSFKKVDDNIKETIVEIPLTVAGTIDKEQREVNLDVIQEKSSPDTKYEIERPVLIKAGENSGVLKVKVLKTSNLSTNPDSITFAIKSSDHLEAGIISNLKKKLVITNMYVRPWWWYDFNLGLWTEEKHLVIIQVLGSDKDIRGNGAEPNFRRGWTHPDALYNIYLLNKYCEEKGLSFRFKGE